MKSMQQLLKGYNLDDKGKYISQEFQDYGYRLAMEMGEEKNKSLKKTRNQSKDGSVRGLGSASPSGANRT